jgi:hypothetical protein
MSYEFLLNAPVLKEFAVTRKVTESYGVEELDADGTPFTRGATRVVEVTEIAELPADRVRLASLANNANECQLFIRFFYGYLGDGDQWRPARRDDGIVIGGPDYLKVDMDLDGEIAESEVLAMCAKLLGWEGSLVEVATRPHEGEGLA